MSEFIPISVVIAERVCARLERALFILESIDESEVEYDLVEIASAMYEAQQTLLRLSRSRRELWSNSPPSEYE